METTSQVWNENWAIFQKRYSSVKLDDVDPAAVRDRIEILTSRKGLPTVRVMAENGKWIFLHSSVDPVQEARKVAAGVDVQPGTILIVYGFALGYLVEALLEAVNEKIPLFIIEPDRKLLYAAMHTRDLRHIIASERVHIVTDNLDEIKGRFSVIYDLARYTKVSYTGLSGHQTVYADCYMKVINCVRDAIAAKVLNRNTMIKIGPDMMSNAIRNLPAYYTHPGVRSLFGRFEGLPAIVVSAGPSLNKNIHLLQEAKGKAVILAVGTAMKALQKWNIEPDFVVTIDPGLPNYRHFQGLDTGNAALITEMQAHYKILEEFKGPMFFSGTMPILRWFGNIAEDKGFVEGGGSVANHAMTAAYKMGADPIVLVGQDLAYARDGHTHAAGTNYENNQYTGGVSKQHFYVKANDGGEILTDYAFNQFRSFFESWFRHYPDREYINATEGGAYIEGTKLMTLREVIDRYCVKPIDVPSAIKQAQNSFQAPSFEPLIETLNMRLQDISDTIREAQAAIKHLIQLEKACQNHQTKQMQRRLKDVGKIYKKFEQDQYIRDVVEWFAHQDIQQVLYRTHQAEFTEQDTYQAAIADYKIYYEQVLAGARTVQGLIENCLEQIREDRRHDEQSLRTI